MHELALTQEIIDILRESAAEQGIKSIHRVRLIIGEMSTALPDAVSFAFEAITPDTILAGAELEIAEEKLELSCNSCDETGFHCPPPKLICPRCGGRDLTIVAGRRLYIDFYEGE